MNAFNAADLKRLKESTLSCVRPNKNVLSKDIWALIARLEAAERVKDAVEKLIIVANKEPFTVTIEGTKELQNALDAWRKAAAK